MSNHPNRNWRKRWNFDASTLIATHESGLVVVFSEAQDCEGALDGKIQGEIPESLNWRSDPKIISSLMRQAGDGMYSALEKQKKH